MTRQEAEACTILRCEVGSTAHGVSVGSDDMDHMGVVLEPMTEACGLGAPFEQFLYRTATERTGKHDAPSEPGDLDLTLYSLRKWLRLALKGNPTILSLLFAPVLSSDARGTQLRELAPLIISRKVGNAYLGYMEAQRQKLLHERGGLKVRRPDLEAKFGFDTKFAYHMLRLGIQGVELLTSGRFSMPVVGPTRDFLLQVRQGLVPLNDCVQRAGDLEVELKGLISDGPIQAEPDSAAVEDWMVRLYFREWSATRTLRDINEDYATFYRKEFEASGC